METETRAYRSKIGRLRFALRNELCERMLDGATGAALCTWLNKHAEVKRSLKASEAGKINAQNLTDWRGTGYKDWLASRARAQHIRNYAEISMHIAEATGGSPAAVGSRILAGKMLDMLEAVDQETADGFSNAVSRLRKGENDSAKIELERRKADRDDEILKLEKDKFRRSTAELYLKWHADRTATDIATGPGTNDEKIKALLAYMDREENRA